MIMLLSIIIILLIILLLLCNWDRVNWMYACGGQANLRITEANLTKDAELKLTHIRTAMDSPRYLPDEQLLRIKAILEDDG